MRPDISQNSSYLLAVTGSAAKGLPAPEKPDGVDWGELFAAADAHDLAPMAYHSLCALRPGDEALAPFREAQRRSMRRSFMQEAEARRVFSALESRGVDYCPLKGWFTRELYPEPSMRVMSDVDILVRPCDRPVSKQIMEELGYTCIRYNTADDDKYKRNGLLIEFHTGLDSDGVADPSRYEDPWKLTKRLTEHGFRMTAEEAYLYTAAHAMKHFMNMGLGIRVLVDIYLYLKKGGLDTDLVERGAEELGIQRFLHVLQKTALAAFGGEEFDPDSAEVLRFMLACGAGGTSEIYENSRMLRLGGGKPSKGKYMLRRVFPSLEEMKKRDGILKKHPQLLPVMYVRRWFQLLFSKRERLNNGLQRASRLSAEEAEKLKRIYDIAGIDQ